MIALIESFGVIPFRKADGVWQVFLILHKEGHHWGFPKGRKNPGEEHLAAAERELSEETGLQISQLFRSEPLIENYSFRHQGKIQKKRVHYYIAEVEGEVVLQPEEIREGRWLPIPQAIDLLSFPEAKNILHTSTQYLP